MPQKYMKSEFHKDKNRKKKKKRPAYSSDKQSHSSEILSGNQKVSQNSTFKSHKSQKSQKPHRAASKGVNQRMTSHSSGKRPQKKKKPQKKRNFFAVFGLVKKIPFTRLISIAVFLGLIAVIAFVIWVAAISRELPRTDGLLDRNLVESTKIFDRTGKHLLYQIHGDERRTAIEITDLPDHVANAFIAIEDKDFYSHNGILPKRIVKAVYDDIMYLVKRTFIPKVIRTKFGIRLNKVQGGSTITQQFIKNAVLTPEKRIARKVKEMILAWQLEQKFTKQQILKMYLNEISYGGVNYGIESAAQSYFKKPAKELTIAESAILAAMINAPSRLSPYGNHKDELLERQQFIMWLMNEQGLITESQYNEAKNQELEFTNLRTGSIKAPHFVMYVRELLESDFGTEESERLLKEGGLKVYTTLDWDLQQLAEEAMEASKENLEVNKASNAALVSMNPKNGEILAMIGSVDYYDLENNGNFNVATSGLRQPGSSIKPMVYVSAFQQGYYPESVVYDVETDFDLGSGSYKPRNYDLAEHGAVTLRKSLAGSLNIPAVKTLYLVGVKKISEIATKLGYSTLQDDSRYGLSLVLGGAEVKLLEHVNAYGAFANDGVLHKNRSILRIEDRNGNIIREYKPEGEKRVLDANAARMLSSILSDNQSRAYAFGLENRLVVKGHTVAAKTGTTNDYKDAWLVGYTPNLVTGVWAGNNNNKSMRRGAGGSTVAGPIWNKFMTDALNQIGETETFAEYPPNTSENPALNGSLENGVTVKIDTISGLLATDETPEDLVEEKVFQDPHSILHYVDRENPSNDIPENPGNDPQYQNWENSIQEWIVRFNEKANANPDDDIEPIEVGTIPTEYDNTHKPEFKPWMTVHSPNSHQTVTSPVLQISVDADSQRGVSQVKYFINEQLIGVSNGWPYEYAYSFEGLFNGDHNLRVEACDDAQNCTSEYVPFTLQLENELSPVRMISPESFSNFNPNSFPVNLSFDVSDKVQILSANIYIQNISTNKRSFIIGLENVTEGFNSIKWNNAPEPGDYYFVIESIDVNNKSYTSKGVQVTVTN